MLNPLAKSDLICYLPEHIPDVWADVHPLIGRALDRGSRYNRTDIFYGLLDGTMQLWTHHENGCINAALVTKLDDDYCLLLACGGENMAKWQKYIGLVECWAKSKGCKEMRIYGRQGWGRALGYEVEYVKLRKPL